MFYPLPSPPCSPSLSWCGAHKETRRKISPPTALFSAPRATTSTVEIALSVGSDGPTGAPGRAGPLPYETPARPHRRRCDGATELRALPMEDDVVKRPSRVAQLA